MLRTTILLPTLFALVAACAGNETPNEPARPDPQSSQPGAPTPQTSNSMTADHEPTRGDQTPHQDALQTATLGAGCFWCIEAVLERIDGVQAVVSGYMGGQVDEPTYEEVCLGTTGHAEVVQVTFDPAVLPYGKLLDWFFKAHNPTTLNQQGPDRGTQYRSAIFCADEAQLAAARLAKARAQSLYPDPIVTEITPAKKFWPAEAYHQDYFKKNPGNGYCNYHIPPKLEKLGLDGSGQKSTGK